MTIQRTINTVAFSLVVTMFFCGFAKSAPLLPSEVAGRGIGTLVPAAVEEERLPALGTAVLPHVRQEMEAVAVGEPELVDKDAASKPPASKGKRQATEPEAETSTHCPTQPQTCLLENDSNLTNKFFKANRVNSPVVQKLRLGNQISHIGTVQIQQQALDTECVDEVRLDFDANRFPQYLMQTSCLQRPDCVVEETEAFLRVLRLDATQCNSKGYQKYDVIDKPQSIFICKRVASVE